MSPFKKRILFLILFSLSFAIFFKFLLWKREQNQRNVHSSSYQKKKIRTPCREIFIESKPKTDKISASRRIDLLTKLTTTPINWILTDLHGQTLDLYCLRGKKHIIIHFWATWCPPCIKELPSLAQLAKTNNDQIFIVAISTESPETIINFLTQAFPDLNPYLKIAQVSPENKSEYFPEDALPVTYIFNKQGLLITKELGPRNWSDIHFIKQITEK